MTRHEFLAELTRRLSTLSASEREHFISYYDEMLSDRMEEGMDEAEAVSSLEPIPEIASRILAETAPALRRQKRGVVGTMLIVLGSPMWAPLLMVVVMAALALVLALWAVWFSLAAAFAALTLAGGAAVLGGALLLWPFTASGTFMMGMGFVSAALGLLLFRPVRFVTLWASNATGSIFKKLRAMRKKEAA